MSKRQAGILMPVFSLPGKYGIGTFGKAAYKFVDFLAAAGQHYWQILPLGPTGYGDSPYQSFSTFAGNPYFIDLETLQDEGLLTRDECDDVDFGEDSRHIAYDRLYFGRYPLLEKAHARFQETEEYKKFLKENDYWLPGYASFMAKKEKRPADFFCFLQYEFFTQWWKLRQYANQKGLEIIGDIPIYVSGDSSDVESDPKLFQLDSEGHPTRVAGCPPDAFSDDGQLWGNPLYDWDYHEKTGFQWWILRMKHCFKLYDVVRVDHFRGFDEYYSIPAGDKTARNGKWMPGPGLKLFEAIEKEIPGAKIIAEDLGFLTDSVKQLVKDTGYPGMKLFEFSFDSRDKESMTPDQWPAHSIGYTGTHDNQTLKAWFLEISKEDRKMVAKYFHTTVLKLAHSDYVGRFLDETLGSAPETVVIPMADYCKFGKEARINFPSTLGKNWTFRFLSSDFTDALQKDILARTEKSGRV